MDLGKEMEELSQHAARIKQDAKAALSDLPDNPRIKRVAEGCFIVSSSDLGTNWSPFHHDFKAQHSKLEDFIEQTPVEHLGNAVGRVIQTGSTGRAGDQGQKFHPDVIEDLEGAFSR